MKQKDPRASKKKQPENTFVPTEEMKERRESCQGYEQGKHTDISFHHECPKYMTVKQWVKKFGFIPEGGVRHLIFSNDAFNKKVVKRLGSKILLDVQAIYDFIEEQNNIGRK